MWKTFLLSGSIFAVAVLAALAAPHWFSPSAASAFVALVLCAGGLALILAPPKLRTPDETVAPTEQPALPAASLAQSTS